MAVQLYNPQVDCPVCERRQPIRVSEDDVARAKAREPGDLFVTIRCYGRSCGDPRSGGTVVRVHIRHLHAAIPAETLPDLTARRLSAAPVVDLTERQTRVCEMVLEGMTDRRIAHALGVSKPTVRKDLRAAAAALCTADGQSCRSLPRGTIVAYYRERTRATGDGEAFRTAA